MGPDVVEAASSINPHVIVCPFLTERVPDPVWQEWITIIIHPGPEGDRGPSSLDWAIADGVTTWGVTALQANAIMDGGPVWGSRTFPVPVDDPPRKSSLYAGPVTEAAVSLALEVVDKLADPSFTPRVVHPGQPGVPGRERSLMRQSDRSFDWADPSADIVRKIRAADGSPGVRTLLAGCQVSVFDAYPGRAPVSGSPGTIANVSHGAVLVNTGAEPGDAVWIGRARTFDGPRAGIKLPATTALHDHLGGVAELIQPLDRQSIHGGRREVRYERHGRVGVVTVDAYNGAWSTALCRRVGHAWHHATAQDTPVILLQAGDVFSNGIDLNTIEAAPRPAREAWDNIVAIDDVCRQIICTEQFVIAAVGGNAGAGGVMLALGADRVIARHSTVFNPHYATMGLFGSEYWTYTLPRRVGYDEAERLTTECRPVGAPRAVQLGLIDRVHHGGRDDFDRAALAYAQQVAGTSSIDALIGAKRLERVADDAHRPLESYRVTELAQMKEDIFDDAHHFAALRRAFVTKRPAPPLAAVRAG
jgi:putative two-component system hydrogenase maturation factor HypX/HoxX